MAENKRIRVSTDTTPLQELRQQGEAVLQSFNQLEERFKNLATDSINLLRQQIDLIKERNDLLSGANLGINPVSEGIGQKKPEDSFKTPIGSINRTDDILKKILERTTSIDSKMNSTQVSSKESKDTKEEDDLGGGNIVNSKLGRKIFSMASMAAIFGIVKRVIGTGVGWARDFQEYSVAQITADNSYQRDLARLESKWMNFFTFGFSRIEAQERRKELSRVEENVPTTKAYSQLYNLSYNQAIAKQVQDYFDEEDFYDTIRVNKEEHGEPRDFWYYFGNAMSAYGSHSTMNETPTIERTQELEERKRVYLPTELNSEISKTLGLSMTDYFKKLSDLGRAGVRASNTSGEDLYQMLLGQAIRGYSDETMRKVLSVTRFNAEGNMSGAGVIQAMDTNLRRQGYDDQYIASTLDEYVGAFSRFAENILGKVGRIETDSMIQSMTSIQNATGTEGRQLERIQNALTGQSVSQDDVTQALLLRTARRMNPNLSMFDLEAMIENMPNDINLQRNFLKTIQDMTGGGDMMKYTLQAVFPHLSKNDILAITEGRKDLASIFDQGSIARGSYDRQNAAEKLTPEETTSAGTANRQLIEGLREIFGAKGEKFEDIIRAIGEKHSVSLGDDSIEVIASGVSRGISGKDIVLNVD